MVLLPQVIEARDSGTPGPVLLVPERPSLLRAGTVKQDSVSALREMVEPSSIKHLAGGSSFASESIIGILDSTISSETGEELEERVRPEKKRGFQEFISH